MLFRVVSVCFSLFWFVSKQLVSVVSNSKPRQRVFMFRLNRNKDQPRQFDREHILVLFRKFRVIFSLIRNCSVCFGCFDIGSKHWNKPKHNRNRSCFCLNQKFFCLFQGHPSLGHTWACPFTAVDMYRDRGIHYLN